MSDIFQIQSSATFLVWLGAGWLLWLPGILLTNLLRLPRSRDLLMRFALQIGLGLVFWPLFFLWTTTLGWVWWPKAAQGFVLVVGLISLIAFFRSSFNSWSKPGTYWRKSGQWLALFCFIAALTIFTRVYYIRPLVLPAWVDSVHHTMIVRLLLAHGNLPATYDPYIPNGTFFYHWGYHALVAWLAWFLGRTEPLEIAQLILQFGQVLNALSALMFYAAGRVLFNSRRAGLFAAMLAALVSWFPAFYVNWGRYPQLVGLLILPVFGITLWKLHKRPTFGWALTTVLLGAGMLLIHVRVTFFALTLAIVLAGFLLIHRAWRTLGLWSLTGMTAILVTLPWLLTLLRNEYLYRIFISPLNNPDAWMGRHSVAWHLVWMPNNRELLALATGGLSGLAGWGNMLPSGRMVSGVWFLLLTALLIRQVSSHRCRLSLLNPNFLTSIGILLLWSIFTAFLLNLGYLGLPPIRIVDNNAGVIALFVPLSLIGGGLLAWVSGQLTPYRGIGAVTALLIAGGSLWGSVNMANIVDLTTILAQPADVRAMEWIQANTPPDAHFVVNVWPWVTHTYAGTDGGYWISVITDRTSVLPPALYPVASEYAEFRQIDALLGALARPHPLDDPALRARLRADGVTHIYIGARGGPLIPEDLLDRPFTRLVYKDGPVHIFEFGDD